MCRGNGREMDGFLREREDGQLAWNAPLQHRLRDGVESHAAAS